jgi:2-dehydropantoate 2-reductase
VLAGTCTYGARLREPGVVACTGVGDVTLGPRDGGTNEAADRVGAALDAGEVAVVVASDLPRRLWTKLAVNAGINATTALARVENGAIVEGPGREVAADAARETARVARSRGVDLSDERAVERTLAVARTTAGNRSSTLQDVAAGRRTEIEAINGAVVERAGEVRVPVNRTLLALVRTWERGRDRR